MRSELTAALGPERAACAAPSSSASTRRHTLGQSAVGTTASRPSSACMPPKIDCAGSPGARAASGDRELAERYDREI